MLGLAMAQSSHSPITPGASAGRGSIFHGDGSAALRIIAGQSNASVSRFIELSWWRDCFRSLLPFVRQRTIDSDAGAFAIDFGQIPHGVAISCVGRFAKEYGAFGGIAINAAGVHVKQAEIVHRGCVPSISRALVPHHGQL